MTFADNTGNTTTTTTTVSTIILLSVSVVTKFRMILVLNTSQEIQIEWISRVFWDIHDKNRGKISTLINKIVSSSINNSVWLGMEINQPTKG